MYGGVGVRTCTQLLAVHFRGVRGGPEGTFFKWGGGVQISGFGSTLSKVHPGLPTPACQCTFLRPLVSEEIASVKQVSDKPESCTPEGGAESLNCALQGPPTPPPQPNMMATKRHVQGCVGPPQISIIDLPEMYSAGGVAPSSFKGWFFQTE